MRCPPLLPEGGEDITLFGAVLFRVVCAVFFKLLIHFERIRANTLGDEEQIKIIMSGAVRLSAVRIALYELFVHVGRIRAVTQGACATCCRFCVVIRQLKYNIMCPELFREQPTMMCNVPIQMTTISV